MEKVECHVSIKVQLKKKGASNPRPTIPEDQWEFLPSSRD